MLVGFVVDAETGATVGVDIPLEQDSQAFPRWLRAYVKRLGLEVLVTDDLMIYKFILDKLAPARLVQLAASACIASGEALVGDEK